MQLTLFLSDLCGREGYSKQNDNEFYFLSDLCGREDCRHQSGLGSLFLSDLCGREVAFSQMQK